MATILIAEDERDIRELIGMTLSFGGHKVFKAANGAEAVELAPTVMPDLIMMDVRMPRMTGFEACIELKKMDSVKHIPVIFLSAKGQEAEIESGLDAGAYDFILKPFSPAELLVRINGIIAANAEAKAADVKTAADSGTSADKLPESKLEITPESRVESSPVSPSAETEATPAPAAVSVAPPSVPAESVPDKPVISATESSPVSAASSTLTPPAITEINPLHDPAADKPTADDPDRDRPVTS